MRSIAFASPHEQGAKSMPLLAYFGTIGSLLMALLLLAGFLLEPPPTSPKPGSAGAETNLPRPKITSRVGQYAAADARTAPAREPRHETSPPAAPQTAELTAWNSAQPATEQQAGAGGERNSFKAAKRKAVQVRTRVRNPGDAGRQDAAWRQYGRQPTNAARAYSSYGYNSYARERPSWQSWAEGTLGPH
jgi:hypothetical protein